MSLTTESVVLYTDELESDAGTVCVYVVSGVLDCVCESAVVASVVDLVYVGVSVSKV